MNGSSLAIPPIFVLVFPHSLDAGLVFRKRKFPFVQHADSCRVGKDKVAFRGLRLEVGHPENHLRNLSSGLHSISKKHNPAHELGFCKAWTAYGPPTEHRETIRERQQG